MKRTMRVLCVSVAIALSPVAGAQTSTNHGQAQVAGKIASNFTTLAGSQQNSLALVNALRTGTSASLVVPAASGTGTGTGTGGTTPPPTTTTVSFTPATGPMGWGNVKNALALAQAVLANAGISNPTPDQLAAALNGGSITVTNADGTTTTTTLKGVLAMRASGMGWGQIAQASGTKLGPVVSSLKMGNVSTASTTTAAGTSAPQAVATAKGASAAQGITTAAGGSSGVVTAGGSGASHGNAYGRGVVTAAGGGASFGATAAATHGQGVMTAAGGPASGISSAQGSSGSHGKPEGKGKGGG
jgi:hypothetical protein